MSPLELAHIVGALTTKAIQQGFLSVREDRQSVRMIVNVLGARIPIATIAREKEPDAAVNGTPSARPERRTPNLRVV